jgi:hypothetical protein
VRKIVSWVLIGLGGFLLAAAVVASTWAPGQAKRAPLDTNSITRLSGTAAVVPTGDTDVAVRAASVTKADADKSDDDVVVYVNFTCLVKDVPDTPDCGEEGTGENADPNVISVGEPSLFATDRNTGLATNEGDYLPDGTPETEGLVNKFGFDTEKKTYPFWDDVLQRAVDVEYQGTKTIDGLETWAFNYVVTDEEAEIASGVDGTYSMDKTMWIEPRTGQIIDQEQHDVRAAGDTTLLDVELSFTDDQVQTNVDDAKDNLDTLDLITKTVPLVGYIGGPLLILAGILGLTLGQRRRDAA